MANQPITRPPANTLYEIDDEIEARLRGDSMQRMDIHAIDIPKSTIAVAGALWLVIAGICSWNLLTTISIKDQQAKEMREIAVEVSDAKGRVAALEGRVTKLEAAK